MATKMLEEIKQTPDLLVSQLLSHQTLMPKLIQHIKAYEVRQVTFVARGSSYHVAVYAKYLFETVLQLPCGFCAPSVATIYGGLPLSPNTLVIGISQSGQSEDICTVLESAKAQHALTLAVVNVTQSRLANAADLVLPVQAEIEIAVAATKSVLLSMTAMAHLVSALKGEASLFEALNALPQQMHAVSIASAQSMAEALSADQNTFCLGRGVSLAVALEAALKFKETSHVHAEAFSSAEVCHGPMTMVDDTLPLLWFVQNDASLTHQIKVMRQLLDQGARVYCLSPLDIQKSYQISVTQYGLPETAYAHTSVVIGLYAFYFVVHHSAMLRKMNPDAPSHLNKVTSTY